MVYFTHSYDFILKLITYPGVLISLFSIPGSRNNGFVVLLLLLLGIVLGFIVYTFLVRTLSSWLYCRYTLNMKVTLAQAKKLNAAFSPWHPFEEWLPMKELKQIDEQLRYPAALEFLKKWEEQN